ncbi:MAG: TraR/DksA family transcriptional regulator [Blastocatellia bacterium]|nr:TraR/DksA family transcriptional regulator [Blastocatellia bacterium]
MTNRHVVFILRVSEIPPQKVEFGNMDQDLLERQRQKLLAKRQELSVALNLDSQPKEDNSEEEGKDPLDAAATYTNRELVARQMEQYRQLLSEVEDALDRIEEGTYGICMGSGEPIPPKRLEAIPWAKYTIDYQERLEQGLVND